MVRLGDFGIILRQYYGVPVQLCLIALVSKSGILDKEISVFKSRIEYKTSTGDTITPVTNEEELSCLRMLYPEFEAALLNIENAKALASRDGISVWSRAESIWK